MIASAAVLLSAAVLATTPDSELPNVWRHAIAPHDGAVNVPTNARLWIGGGSPQATIQFGEVGAPTRQLTAEDLGRGLPVPGLEPQRTYVITLDDGNTQPRTIRLTTGDRADGMRPAAPAALTLVSSCSYFTECGPEGMGYPAEDALEYFNVTLTVPRASDDTGAAMYRVYITDDAGAFVRAGVAGGDWVEPTESETVTIQTWAEIGREDTVRSFRVTAVDLAGNESEPSPAVEVLFRRSRFSVPHLFGCSAAGGASMPLLAVSLLLLRRRRPSPGFAQAAPPEASRRAAGRRWELASGRLPCATVRAWNATD